MGADEEELATNPEGEGVDPTGAQRVGRVRNSKYESAQIYAALVVALGLVEGILFGCLLAFDVVEWNEFRLSCYLSFSHSFVIFDLVFIAILIMVRHMWLNDVPDVRMKRHRNFMVVLAAFEMINFLGAAVACFMRGFYNNHAYDNGFYDAGLSINSGGTETEQVFIISISAILGALNLAQFLIIVFLYMRSLRSAGIQLKIFKPSNTYYNPYGYAQGPYVQQPQYFQQPQQQFNQSQNHYHHQQPINMNKKPFTTVNSNYDAVKVDPRYGDN
jgi:hypothetical protein